MGKIRVYTVILFVLFILSMMELNVDVVAPYRQKLNVQRVFDKLALVSGTTRMEPLVVLDSEVMNAWTDGTNITITTAFLSIIKNNDELAMILGHEMGHVLNGDVTRGGQPIDSRYLEANADKLGAYIMMRAGFDVCLGKEIFRTFKETFGDEAATESHPDNAFRLDQLDLPMCHD